MSKRLEKTLYILTLIAIFILIIYAIKLIKLYNILSIILNLISPIILGYILAWLIIPLYEKLNKKFPPKLSILVLIITIILLYILIIILILPIIINETSNLITIIKAFLPKIKKISYLSNLEKYINFNPSIIINSCSNIASILMNFVLSHIFGFYILYHFKNINTFLKSLLPKKHKAKIINILNKISTNERCYIKGTFLDSLVLFIITLVCFLVLNLKYAVLLAFFCAITNVIPFIGPYIGGVPAVIVGLSTNIKLGVIVLIVIFVSQTIESNIINPLIMSKCTKVNPLAIIISITIMGKFFGIIGMLFAIPLVIAIKTLYESKIFPCIHLN